MGGLAFVAIAALAGCSFHRGGLAGSDPSSQGDAGVGDGDPDSVPDGPIQAKFVYGSTGPDLYTIDVATMKSQFVGTMEDPNNPGNGLNVDALGYLDGELVGVAENPFYLVKVDPETAHVTSAVAMTAQHTYWGATVAPAGELDASATLLVAANDTGSLYRVQSDGSISSIGSFGGGLAVAGDIAWVPGQGLFASVSGSGCSGTCIASIASNGQATLLKSSGPGDLWSLAAFGGELWAIGGNGQWYKVNLADGTTTGMFQLSSLSLSDAAP